MKILTVTEENGEIILVVTGGEEIVLDRENADWLIDELVSAFERLHGTRGRG